MSHTLTFCRFVFLMQCRALKSKFYVLEITYHIEWSSQCSFICTHEYGRCTNLVRLAIYIHHQLTSYIATPVILPAFPAFFLSGGLAPFCSCRLVLSRSVSLAKYLVVLVELTASSTIVRYVRLCLAVYLWCNISTPIFLPSTVTFC